MRRDKSVLYGECACGTVKFSVCAQPLTLFACHCDDCQRWTGSAFSLAYFVARSEVMVSAGRTSSFSMTLTSGRVRSGADCANCGTRLWTDSRKVSGYVAIQGGLLKGLQLQPVAHLWVQRRLSFVELPSKVQQYDTQPEQASELVELWRNRPHS